MLVGAEGIEPTTTHTSRQMFEVVYAADLLNPALLIQPLQVCGLPKRELEPS